MDDSFIHWKQGAGFSADPAQERWNVIHPSEQLRGILR